MNKNDNDNGRVQVHIGNPKQNNFIQCTIVKGTKMTNKIPDELIVNQSGEKLNRSLLHDPVQHNLPEGTLVSSGKNTYCVVFDFFPDVNSIPKPEAQKTIVKEIISGTRINERGVVRAIDDTLVVSFEDVVKVSLPKGTKLQQVDEPIELVLNKDTVFTVVK
jgi:hypothetical protein